MFETSAPAFRSIEDFAGARNAPSPVDRLAEVRRRAEQFRERFMDEPQVVFYASYDVVRVPYPAWYAYAGVHSQSMLKLGGLLHLLSRVFIIQYHDFENRLRTLLFTPADVVGNRETPFFKRLGDRIPEKLLPFVAPIYNTVEQVLAKAGIKPELVDYISYDHLHTQDVRKWLGTGGNPGYFPEAKLLVHRKELASVKGLLPWQADWYCPGGLEGIDPARIVEFEEGIQPGRGIALIHSPGHTEGNHSLVCRVPDGIRVTSENGVGVDSYAPQNSRVNAIRRYARNTGAEVILNGNTLEGSNDQYISMVMEKTIAGPSRNPDYPNCVTSSEATPYWLLPGNPVSFLFGETRFGTPVTA